MLRSAVPGGMDQTESLGWVDGQMERLAEQVADKTEKPALGFVVADKMELLLVRAVADRLGPAAVAGRMEQIGLAVGWLGLPEQVVAGKGEWMLEIVARGYDGTTGACCCCG